MSTELCWQSLPLLEFLLLFPLQVGATTTTASNRHTGLQVERVERVRFAIVYLGFRQRLFWCAVICVVIWQSKLFAADLACGKIQCEAFVDLRWIRLVSIDVD